MTKQCELSEQAKNSFKTHLDEKSVSIHMQCVYTVAPCSFAACS